MTDINKVIVIGNLTRGVGEDERSFGYTANGTARASVSIAVNRSVKKGDNWEDEVSYIDVTIWGKTAENLKPYFVKGQRVTVEGHLKQDRWEKDGQKNSRVSIVADAVYLCGSKKDSGNNMDSILAEEMTFLTEQVDDMYRWKDENQELFAKELPSGRTALKNYTKLTRAIKKLQVSKTATKAIYSAKAYKSFTKESRRDFEDTMRKIWAMHSYVSGLIALAGRFYTTIMEGNSMEGELLSWDATLKVAEKEDFKNI